MSTKEVPMSKYKPVPHVGLETNVQEIAAGLARRDNEVREAEDNRRRYQAEACEWLIKNGFIDCLQINRAMLRRMRQFQLTTAGEI
jgi:hypothetical protein